MCAADMCSDLSAAAVSCACPGLLAMLADGASSCGYSLERTCDTPGDQSYVLGCATQYAQRGCVTFEPGSGSCALSM